MKKLTKILAILVILALGAVAYLLVMRARAGAQAGAGPESAAESHPAAAHEGAEAASTESLPLDVEGAIAYVRDGVVYLRELRGEHRETRLAPAERQERPREALCPTFLPDGKLLVVETGVGLWVFDPATGEGAPRMATPNLVALGLDRATGDVLVGMPNATSDPKGSAGAWHVETVRDWTEVGLAGIGATSTGAPGIVADRYGHRIRATSDRSLLAVPRFPARAEGAAYELRTARASGGFELVGWGSEEEPDSYVRAGCGVDLGPTDAYVAVCHAEADSLAGEVYRLPAGEPERRARVLRIEGTELGEIAVSESLNLLAVETRPTQGVPSITLYRLSDGRRITALDGGDPDLWPR